MNFTVTFSIRSRKWPSSCNYLSHRMQVLNYKLTLSAFHKSRFSHLRCCGSAGCMACVVCSYLVSLYLLVWKFFTPSYQLVCVSSMGRFDNELVHNAGVFL